MSATIDLGKLGFNFRDDWVPNAAPPYVKNDAVRYANNLWIAKSYPGAEETPDQSISWGLGIRGPQGLERFGITTSGNWTVPHKGKYRLFALGGGGGGGSASASPNNWAAGGGGASGACEEIIIDLTENQNLSVNIGAGGPSNGNGGTTTINSQAGNLLTAVGGRTGESTGPGSSGNYIYGGGYANGNGANIGGNAFIAYYSSAGVPSTVRSGNGASSPFGQGGACVSATTNTETGLNGNDAAGFGAGGSGAVNYKNTASAAGGNGSPGLVIIEFLG